MEATTCVPEVPSEPGGWWDEDWGKREMGSPAAGSLAACLGVFWAFLGEGRKEPQG